MVKKKRLPRHKLSKNTRARSSSTASDQVNKRLQPLENIETPPLASQHIDGIIDPVRRDLFLDWTDVLLEQNLKATYHGGTVAEMDDSPRQHNYILPNKSLIKIEIPSGGKTISIECPIDHLEQCVALCIDARKFANEGQTGSPNWWTTRFGSSPELNDSSFLHIMRNMDQHKRYQGDFKIGVDGYIKINQLGEKGGLVLLPGQTFEVRFRSIGPGHGPFARKIANRWATLIRGLLCLASASRIDGVATLFPVKNEHLDEAQKFMKESPAGELHIDGVALWPRIVEFYKSGATEALDRLQNALQSFEQALYQKNDGAAIVFFVTAIEALATPNAKWKQERITKRFIDHLLMTCQDVLGEALTHANCEMAFGKTNNEKQLAEKIYKLRSARVHTGNFGGATSGLFGENTPSQVRVMLVSDITHAAIFRFLTNPLTMLTGHPSSDPKITIWPDLSTYREIETRSVSNGHKNTEDWLLEMTRKFLNE